MPYMNQQHTFSVDNRYPTDVFDELETFFSAYTSSIDNIQNLSIGLQVSPDFDIQQQKIAKRYQQFCQTVRYSVPDVHILAVKTLENDDNVNKLILTIQYLIHDDNDEKNQGSFFGRLFPTFVGKKTEKGDYPLPKPTAPTPLPTQPKPSVPKPSVSPQAKPQSPTPVNVAPVTPKPVQATPPKPISVQPTPQSIATPQPQYLPSSQHSMQAFYRLLVEKIAQSAKTKNQPNQVMSTIVLKPHDGISRAFVEQIFASFSQKSTDDSVDMVSFGFEWLKPALQKVGVIIADDTAFELRTKAKTTADDVNALANGQVKVEQIQIDIDFKW